METENRQRYPGSLVSPEAKIGQNVRIGFACHIYPWAEIGDGGAVGDYAERRSAPWSK